MLDFAIESHKLHYKMTAIETFNFAHYFNLFALKALGMVSLTFS